MKRAIGTATTALALASSAAHADPPCDGHYRSWAECASAVLSSRRKPSYSTFSSRGPSTYEVIYSELGGDKPRVAYQFKKRSKQCSFEVTEIVGQRERYWGIRGYTSVEHYRERRDDPAAYAACPVDPMPSGRCNLPFAQKKK
jgi:hypothetical protein